MGFVVRFRAVEAVYGADGLVAHEAGELFESGKVPEGVRTVAVAVEVDDPPPSPPSHAAAPAPKGSGKP